MLRLQLVPVAAGGAEPATRPEMARIAELSRRIPFRSSHTLTGSQFAEAIRRMDSRQRERAVKQEIVLGNMPAFLRQLVPVNLSDTQHKGRTTTVFVMPDYLAIGSDVDFLRIPMNLETATDIAARFEFVLPTRRIVDAIYAQSAHHFVPQPLTPGPQMSSTDYYVRHNAMIDAQARDAAVEPGTLVSGHKKDLVVTNLLARTPGRIAIYGWQRLGGAPIQPLSTVHGACYEDYSHGVRLVSDVAWQDGTFRSVRDILQDPLSAAVLSDEGVLRAVFASGAPSQRELPAPLLATFTAGFCSNGTKDGN
jgi:hypothetical protein